MNQALARALYEELPCDQVARPEFRKFSDCHIRASHELPEQ